MTLDTAAWWVFYTSKICVHCYKWHLCVSNFRHDNFFNSLKQVSIHGDSLFMGFVHNKTIECYGNIPLILYLLVTMLK